MPATAPGAGRRSRRGQVKWEILKGCRLVDGVWKHRWVVKATPPLQPPWAVRAASYMRACAALPYCFWLSSIERGQMAQAEKGSLN